MKKLNKTVKIDPKFTASDWQLYSFKDEPARAEESKVAAKAINRALKLAVNSGASKDTARIAVYQVMCFYAAQGSVDTEPRTLLLDILDDIYG